MPPANQIPDKSLTSNVQRAQSHDQRTQGAATKSNSIEIPQVSLPKGGGAIKRIDEKFEVNAANGTASFSLPLPFSPARNGFMPAIALGYNSGAGNGIFGLGWDLGYPSIQRKTDKRLPRYKDADESDTFMFSGAEDLVPFLMEEGETWKVAEFVQDNYSVRRYRPRIEGGLSRIEKISHPEYGIWWKVTTRENVVTFFGKSADYRITDPANPEHIFQWLPELSFDDKGNCVLYQFKAESGDGYRDKAVFDANRFDVDGKPRFVNRYLKRVFYCPKAPFLPFQQQGPEVEADVLYQTANPAPSDFLMELVLDYGEHGVRPDKSQENATINYTETNAWDTRHDAFSSYRAGFDIRTARLCQRVLMFHHFEQLGTTPCLVRSLDLQYRDWSLQEEPEQGKKMEVTYLVAATQRSYIRQPNNDTAYRYRDLPPMEFRYQELKWDKTVKIVATEDVANAPAGLSSGYQWTDLYNEGIAGILSEQGEGWFYKENLGNGHFTPAKPVIAKPSFTGLASGVLQLQDLEADGRKQVVLNSPGLNGYFELSDAPPDEGENWENFRAFEQVVNVDLRDPNTRMLDLNGDGQPEIVITEENVFTWYPAAGVKGYDSPELAPKAFDEEQGPAIVFADSTQSIFLADMSGDGLTDIARIRNGEVCYWPNLGYGRFGAKVTMHDSPWFDAPDHFNPAYLQLSDVSGTGATDLLYLGKNRFRAWLNLSGNAWSAPCDIDPFPDTAQPNQISVTDLLGNGTSCIVWSSPLPGNAGTPLRYIDLMGGKKPHILVSCKNNLGKTTAWTYKSSTHYYLEDKKAGKPWITKLPFPVQVVSRVTVEDSWRNTCFSQQYSYHHGYYDHPEREFRGFGRVEQTDIEDFGTFEAGNAGSPYITRDKTLYQPPVKTITWYHTGAFLSRERILNQFEQEYFRPDGGIFRENELPEPDLDAQDLSVAEYREALRACKGMALRTETYELAIDDELKVSDRRVRLYSTAFHNCHIQRIQPQASNRHAVFLATESEAITYQYELDLTLPPGAEGREADPRIAHTLNLNTDEFGNVLQSVAIGYPRWQDAALNDPLLPIGAEALIQNVQRERHIAYTENRFTEDFATARDYRLRVPCEVSTFELSGFQPDTESRYFSLGDFRQYRLSAVHQEHGLAVQEIAYQNLPNLELNQKRLVEQVRMLYFAENLRDPLPFGALNRLGLPYETYKIALTEDLVAAVLGDKLPSLQQAGETYPLMLRRVMTEGGYHEFPAEPGVWWIRSGTAGIQSDAAAHFYLPERYISPFNTEERPIVNTLSYDPLDLFIQSSRDPVGNTVAVEDFDYRVLAPTRMRDLNDNISEVIFDILGMPAAMALRGKGDQGDSLDNFDDSLLHPDGETIRRFFTGDFDENEARRLLGNATARHLYYLGEITGADGTIAYGEHPACAAGILREKHVATLGAGEISPIQIGFEYSDGMGTVIATKVQAEPETGTTAPRWITNGKTVLNNKGKPVKQYEPYFTGHHRFEEPQEIGVTPILYYDAAGRNMRTELPDGTFSRVAFSPWFMRSYDANDTVLESRWFSERGGDPALEETADAPIDPDRRAAFLAKIHANTPSETHLDSLGREVVAIAHNRFRRKEGNHYTIINEKYLTFTKLDAEGKPLWLQDARDNYVMVYARVHAPGDYQNMRGAGAYVPAYDLAGNLLFQHSNEAGDRWMLPDVTGQPMYAWDLNERAGTPEHRLSHTEYDALRRPTHQWLQSDAAPRQLISRITYGESVSNGPEHNLRGQAIKTDGPEGYTEVQAFDFKGDVLEVRRQLVRDATLAVVDWQSNPALLPETFVQSTQYDALKRMIRLENWHIDKRIPAIYTPLYNRRGVLESETLSLNGQAATDAIKRIEYDAKGQRSRIQYGNGTTTRYDYDPFTFRLTRLLTTGRNGTAFLQDLRYTYDPMGNIAQIEDLAQDTSFFRNQYVKPVLAYEYDALYQLISAAGREHASNTAPGPIPIGAVANISDEHNLRIYTQYYNYDPAGNFVEMNHVANGGSWTRHYETDPRSNRLLRTWLGSDETNAIRYNYDTHGSMLNFSNTALVENDEGVRLPQWDHRDMIHHFDLGGGGQAWYNYDSGKQRTRKHIVRRDGTVEMRLYLGGYELYRRYHSNDIVEEIETQHLFVDDQRVLIVEDVLQTDSNKLDEGILYRYQYGNHLGSVALEMTGDPLDPQTISYEEYHPYGTTAFQATNGDVKAAAKRYRYTGMERDEESGLAYHTARYYLGWLGRWGSCDPIGVQGGLNSFVYCNCNPVNLRDTNGKQSTSSFIVDLGESATGFVEGVATSVLNTVTSTAQALRHPLDTVAALLNAPGQLGESMERAYSANGGGLEGASMALHAANPMAPAVDRYMTAVERGDSRGAGRVAGETAGPILLQAGAGRALQAVASTRAGQALASRAAAVRSRVASGAAAVRERVASGAAAVRERVASGAAAVRERVASGAAAVRERAVARVAAVRERVAARVVTQESDLAIVNAEPRDLVVDRSARALATSRGESPTTLGGLWRVPSGERLSLVAHGSPASLGGYNSGQLGRIINTSGVKPSSIELVACQTGTARFAPELASLTGTPVRAPLGNVNVMAGIQGVPQVRLGGQLAAPGIGWRTYLPVIK